MASVAPAATLRTDAGNSEPSTSLRSRSDGVIDDATPSSAISARPSASRRGATGRPPVRRHSRSPRRTTRSISRCASRSAIACRLSTTFRPRASASSTFTRPPLK